MNYKSSAVAAIASLSLLACGGEPQELIVDESSALLSTSDELKRSTLNQQLAAVRRATAKYHQVDEALADGHFQASPCVETPAGAMGFHYINMDLVMGPPTLESPAALLYLPEGDGLRLVGVEYITPVMTPNGPYFGCGVGDGSCPPQDAFPAPSLFDGVTFDGPFPPKAPGTPWTYEQHVWIWAHNPSGMFAPFNPAITCGGGAESDGHDHH